MNGTSSHDASNGKHRATIAQEPALRRIASVDCILKHLRLYKKGPEQTAPNYKGCSLAEPNIKLVDIDSVKKARTSVPNMSTNHPKRPEPFPTKCPDHRKEQPLLSMSYSCTSEAKPLRQEPPQTDRSSEESCQQHDEILIDTNDACKLEEYSLPTSFGKHGVLSQSAKSRSRLLYGAGSRNRKRYDKSYATIEPFDICSLETEKLGDIQLEAEDMILFGSPLDLEDEGEAIQVDQVMSGPNQIVLRPGMILLKSYISCDEQIHLIKKCRELGLGSGGFYQPGYNDGAKLRLHMMCLGLDWNPQSRKYMKWRRIDRSKPPEIPHEFHMMVNRAMLDSHALIRREFEVCNAEEILPHITPDICIVNFYTETGRLGLHQDRDESKESLSRGLPVVSFSVGDSAEFLYGDQRDPNKAEKVILESGDVLIFGGESRHVFHGIASIIPCSAPKYLLEKTGFRPGRLNLTFRQC